MNALIDYARQHIASITQDLEGDEDFMPFMTIRTGNDDIVYAALTMPDSAEEKDGVADMVMTLCMLHRGKEVVFASTSYMATGPAMGTRPSQSPRRKEVVFMLAATLDGLCRAFSAPVVRKDNAVRIGEWESLTATDAGGRFGDAISTGMSLGAQIPPEMCEFIDDELRAGRAEGLLGVVMGTVADMRKKRTNAVWN